MAYFKSRYALKGLYLLDEPENALSPVNQLRLVRIINSAAGCGHAQFILATHSPILLAIPGAEIYSFDHIPARTVRFEDTDHFRLYRDFIKDPRRVIRSNGYFS
jgi:predicted ATPase